MLPNSRNFNTHHCNICFDVGQLKYPLKGGGTSNTFCECDLGRKLKSDSEYVDPRPKFTYEISGDIRLYSLEIQKDVISRTRFNLITMAIQDLWNDEDSHPKINLELEFSYREVNSYGSTPEKSTIKGAGYPTIKDLALIQTHNKLQIELRAKVNND
jgi:hypothetical protein